MDTPKAKKSHIAEVDERLRHHLEKIAQDVANTEAAMTELLALEKKTRHDNDLESSKKLARAIVQIHVAQKNWVAVREFTQTLCRRHAQLKPVVVEVVRLAMDSFRLTPDDDSKLRLLKVLREVSRGKMHVEYEYAKMTRAFSWIKEKAGDLRAASDVLQEVNVEALSSMAFEEKFDFLLEQFRLTLAVGDFERAEVASEKFNVKWLDKKCARPAPLKKRYYDLLVQYHLHRKSFLEVAGAHLSLMGLEKEEDTQRALVELKKAALYSTVSAGSKEVVCKRKEVLRVCKRAAWVEGMETFEALLVKLTEHKFVDPAQAAEISSACYRACEIPMGGSMSDEDALLFANAVKDSVVHHNIDVAATHYSRISLERLSQLTKQDLRKSEGVICEMVQRAELAALIDRPARVVDFRPHEGEEARMDGWAAAIEASAEKVERACCLIEKERTLFLRMKRLR